MTHLTGKRNASPDKDASQKSKATVIAATVAEATILANETWILG
jgi:hypothetical protein